MTVLFSYIEVEPQYERDPSGPPGDKASGHTVEFIHGSNLSSP